MQGTRESLFRSRAWVQAWIDTWGSHAQIKLIDLGGRGDPLEHVYITRARLKKILPVSCLCLAGTGWGAIATPRAEYNNLDSLVSLAGSVAALADLLRPLSWQIFSLPDVIFPGKDEQLLQTMASALGGIVHNAKCELAYSVAPQPWESYLANLGANTRLAYYNRRKLLSSLGVVEIRQHPLHEADAFFAQLNSFHSLRWGRPCYAPDTLSFMFNLGQRLPEEGGRLLLESLAVNGEIVSVLVDIEWQGTRYNLQSGYYENRYAKIALGALHMGYAIESALQQHCAYDFMAGQGKHSNYKARIATEQQPLVSYQLERGLLKPLRQLQMRFKAREMLL